MKHSSAEWKVRSDSWLGFFAHKQAAAGDPGGSRTPNPQFRRLMLYPVELRGRFALDRLPFAG